MNESRDAPPLLYRFRSLASETERTRIERSVSESRVYFPSPSSFNDPFDCRPTFSLSGTPQQRKQYVTGLYARQAPHLSRQQRRAEVRGAMKNPGRFPDRPESAREFARFYYDNIANQVGVACLTDRADHPLMWAHYADGHRGICLIYKWESPFFGRAQEVQYRAERPVVNPVHMSHEEMLNAALLTKDVSWSYEREWRLIQYRRGPGEYAYAPTDFVGVILGASATGSTSNMVQSWLHRLKHNVAVFKAALSENRYQLIIRKT